MSDQSPFFIHSVELLIHSMELFRQVDDRKYSAIVLHLANAVELLLQDRLMDAGHSIYETNKSTTLSVNKVLDHLKKERVKIPERPFLELLFENRKTIHHRFGHPDLKTVYQYIDQVTGFMKRFIHDEYGIVLADVLRELGQADDDLQLLGVLEGQGNVLAFLDKLFALSPESAILQAFNFVEGKFAEYAFLQAKYLDPRAKKSFLRASQKSPEFLVLLDMLLEEQVFTQDLIEEMDLLRIARNYAIYRDTSDANPPDWTKALNIAKALIVSLDKAIESKYESAAEEENILPQEEEDA
ncbi:hypothetical protein GF339_19105 [candidate division KSB3 bacterium]|uniref:Uncharacterized protein n=1 Tax=candidate division KSB3 bacterium TaxID=2044937 RepID=A0A9D5Q8A6_9BACT|nr:hypothetical protein [candidate division KSB3 bacterium]MBD3326701.1 hypothetical protein [candidate division KSB3 bacterium]